MVDYCDLFREFEIKKRKYSNMSDRIMIRVPIALNDGFQEKHNKPIKDHIATRSQYKDKVSWVGDKLRLEPEIAKTLFQNACVSSTNHLKSLFKLPEVKDVPTILMVGGFSESPMLQEIVQNALPDKQVIIPADAGLAVLKGAVIYGHDPSVIQERRCRYTYGVQTSHPFKVGVDPIEKKFTDDDGDDYCSEKFGVHVHVGQAVGYSEKQEWHSYSVVKSDQKAITFKFFATEDSTPNFTTDSGCKEIGKLEVDVPGSGMGRSVKVRMIFGDTELHAEAIVEQTNQKTKASLNFLG